jgi:solute carrier family 35 (UDP-sugar transporter), member A1/2/3
MDLLSSLTPRRLVTLAIQNSALTIIMHYSRVSMPPSRTYSAATAVLMNEILKGSISLIIAFTRIDLSSYEMAQAPLLPGQRPSSQTFLLRLRRLWKDVWSPDCWKLSIPAILYGKILLLVIPETTTYESKLSSRSK